MKKYFLQIQMVFLSCSIVFVTISCVTSDTVKYVYDDAGRLTTEDYGDKSII